jgi:hypothetical protein
MSYTRIDAKHRVAIQDALARRHSIPPETFEQICVAIRLEGDDEGVPIEDLIKPDDPWRLEAETWDLREALADAEAKLRYRLPDLRKFARGKECQLRLRDVCCGRPETVVLCHVRKSGNAGIGQKPCDLSAFHACATCHDVYDRRTPPPRFMSRPEIELAAFEAMCRTHDLYRREWGFR